MEKKQERTLSACSEEERQHAMERFRIIQPFIEGKGFLNQIASDTGIPLPTLNRWVKIYRKNGLAGLIRKRRSDRGKHRIVPDELKLLIEGLALQSPPRSITSIHRQIITIAKEKSWLIPSYKTVANIINRIDPGLRTLALKGEKVYKNQYDLIYRRESSRPNEIWQADHSLLDIWIFDEQGNPARPWLTIIMDDYSRAVAGYYLSCESPSILRTALTLRQAISRKANPHWQIQGIPDKFYTDNGSDFTSKHLEQVSADIKMQLVFSIPGQPRGRGKIERFFETVNQLLLSNLSGYNPNGQFPEGGPVLTLKQLETLFMNWLILEYNSRKHGETGMPPMVRWKNNAFLPRLPESTEQLDLLLLTVSKSRRVRTDGIHFQNYRYMSHLLSAYVGEDVMIRYDPRDMAEIRVFYDNKFLCIANCQELSEETVSLKEVISARNKRRRELKKILSNRKQIIEKYIEVHNSNTKTIETQQNIHSFNKGNKDTKSGLRRYFND